MEGSSWYFSDDILRRNSPSRKDGISEEREKGYRRKTCFFIDEAGNSLKLPKLTVATAHVFFHRFFARQSFKQHDRFDVAAACLHLAGKVEESPKKLEVVAATCHAVRHRGAKTLEKESEESKIAKEKILTCERILLHTMGFDMCIEHPYKYLIEVCKKLKNKGIIGGNQDDAGGRQFAQTALNFVNDSFRTSLCLRHPPPLVAAGAVFLAALFAGLRPEGRLGAGWLRLLAPVESGFDQLAFEHKLYDICRQVMELYQGAAAGGGGGGGAAAKHRDRFARMGLQLQERAAALPPPPLPPTGARPTRPAAAAALPPPAAAAARPRGNPEHFDGANGTKRDGLGARADAMRGAAVTHDSSHSRGEAAPVDSDPRGVKRPSPEAPLLPINESSKRLKPLEKGLESP